MADPERVRSRLGALEADIQDLAARQDVSLQVYQGDRDLQAIVERRFETAIQACLDVAAHIVAADGFREPSDYGDLFHVLAEEGILSSEAADRMVELAGFRNVLAHEYADIEHERVHEHLEHLHWFRGYAEAITEYLDSRA